MNYSDIDNIIDFIIESINNFILYHQVPYLTVIFQYLEHFQNSQYNFMNINSIDHDDDTYIFKVNKRHFQYNLLDISSTIVLSDQLLTIMENGKIYLAHIENKDKNYGFDLVQNKIKGNYSSIIGKYNTIYNYIVAFETLPNTDANIITLFTNIKTIFNDKIELLKMFVIIDKMLHIYYFNVDDDFAKSFVTKIHIPQFQLSSNVQIDKPCVNSCSTTIFSSTYSSFFNTTIQPNTSCINTTCYFDPCTNNNLFDAYDNFIKIKHGLFDKDHICSVKNEFTLYLDKDYVRFSSYDITTDIFYVKLVAFNIKLLTLIEADYMPYIIP